MERRKLIEINRVVGQKRFIRLIGQHPVAQCVAQNGVGLTKNADVLLGQRILKNHIGMLERGKRSPSMEMLISLCYALDCTCDVLKADADKLAEFFLREVAGMAIFAEATAEGLIIHLHHGSKPPFEMK